MLPWFQQMDRAQDTGEVVGIARDYLSTWTPEELARLPRGCRPGRIREPSDIEYLHSCAVDAYRATRASGDELKALQLLTSFLVRASIRIAQLTPTDPAAPEGENPTTTLPPKRVPKSRDY
jgi:hypothetical protein